MNTKQLQEIDDGFATMFKTMDRMSHRLENLSIRFERLKCTFSDRLDRLEEDVQVLKKQLGMPRECYQEPEIPHGAVELCRYYHKQVQVLQDGDDTRVVTINGCVIFSQGGHMSLMLLHQKLPEPFTVDPHAYLSTTRSEQIRNLIHCNNQYLRPRFEWQGENCSVFGVFE